MKIGISSSCFYPALTEDAFTKACALGSKTAEIFFNSTEELRYPLLQKFIDIKNSFGVTLNTIHPFTSFIESPMLFSGYERRVREGIYYYKYFFEAAAELGAKAIVLHGGRPVTPEKENEYIEVYNRLCDAADGFGVSPAVENVVSRMGENINFLKRLRDSSGGRFKTVLDIKQSRRAGVDEFEFIRNFADDIVQVHLSDYNSTLDCVPPGEGRYDFKKLFNALEKSGYGGGAVIELYNWSYKSEEQIKKSRIFLENL